MPELDDDNLDALLREHYAAELDPELDPGPGGLCAIQPPAALAGCTTAARRRGGARGLPVAGAARRDPVSPPTVVAQRPAVRPLEHEVKWNTIDEGTVFVNGDVPMRSIRRQRVDHLKWFDESSNATMEMSVPDDEIVLIGLNAN